MKVLLSFVVVLVLGAWFPLVAEAQPPNPVPEGVNVKIAWEHDCTHICNQPAGSAGFRFSVDDVLLDVIPGNPSGVTYEFDIGEPVLGQHSVEVEAFNSATCVPDGCSRFLTFNVIAGTPPAAPTSITIIVDVQ